MAASPGLLPPRASRAGRAFPATRGNALCRDLVNFGAMRLIDRIARTAVRLGMARRSTALLETTGRKSALPRVTPVTNGLDGDTFWIVTEHGRKADYVRNIEAQPKVRVNVSGRWRSGTAQILDEDSDARLAQIVVRNPRARANTQIVRKTRTEHLVIRVDLD